MKSLRIKTVEYRNEIAAIKHIRTKVFQSEQGVSAELEFDGLDDEAVHLLAYLDDQAVGTARIRNIDAVTAKIERLAVLPEARKQGIGKKLMDAEAEPTPVPAPTADRSPETVSHIDSDVPPPNDVKMIAQLS